MSHNIDKVIIALDVSTREQALNLVAQLPEAKLFKLGLQLFTAEGPPLLREIIKAGKNVFLDLKLHDIPNTVGGAVKMATEYGIKMMTLHASGGKEMMVRAVAAAVEAEQAGKTRPLLLAVTVLTSLKDEQLQEIGFNTNAAGQVLKLAELAWQAGVDGIVCSPLELDLIRKEFSHDLLVVTPGIRPAWAAAQDQKRILTPSRAVAKGADFLVIGRPVIAAPSPQTAFLKIINELDGA